MTAPTAYPYQADAIERMRAEARRGHRAICLVLPTGGGKTVVATLITLSHLDRVPKPHVLFVAHRTELIEQAARTMRDAGVARVRTINAGKAAGDDDPLVTVASVQTLSSVKWRDKLPDATMLVFDETHHVKASTWLHLANRYKSSFRVGLTATPERADGSPLGDIFTAIVEVASVRQLTDLGFLAPCDVYAPREQDTSLAEDPIAAYTQWGHGRRCVVFVPTVPYARALAEQFTCAGINAAAVDGTMSGDARKEALDLFREGKTRVMVNAQLLTEGWDDPGVDVCILTRNPDHAGTYLQMVGRVLRIDRSRPDKRATLIDLRGTTIKHGLPDDEREWSLDGEPIRLSARAEPVKQCPQCGYVAHPWRGGCPQCGFEQQVKLESLEVDGRGVELVTRSSGGESRYAFEKRAKEFYRAQIAIAKSRGFKLGWAWHQYRKAFPDGPACRVPAEDREQSKRERTEREQARERAKWGLDWTCSRCRTPYSLEVANRWTHATRDRECEQCMLDTWGLEPTEGVAQ